MGWFPGVGFTAVQHPHLPGQTMLDPSGSPAGCWCPDGLVLAGERRCVRPRECPCEVEGVRYWPGQLVKVNCRICTCQDGQPRRCRQNPECTGRRSEGRQGTGGKGRASLTCLSGPSELRLVGLVTVGRVSGAMRRAEHPVVLPQPQQPQQARQWAPVPRHLSQGPQVMPHGLGCGGGGPRSSWQSHVFTKSTGVSSGGGLASCLQPLSASVGRARGVDLGLGCSRCQGGRGCPPDPEVPALTARPPCTGARQSHARSVSIMGGPTPSATAGARGSARCASACPT